MEQIVLFSEDISSDGQEYILILQRPKFYYLVHNRPKTVHIRRKTDPVHALPAYFRQIKFNIIPPSNV